MNSEPLLNQNEFFKKHFQEALIIRAICDDFNFPGEYSPVFIDIHIRGPKYFQSLPLSSEKYKIVFQFIDYSSQDKINNILENMEDNEIKEYLNNMCIKNKLAEMDKMLQKKENKSDFFSKQIKMMKRFYLDDEFRNHMITLYTFFVKPFIHEYDDKKIKKAFQKGKLREINQQIKDCKEIDNPEDMII